MNEDRIEGTAKKVVGSAQEAIGDVAGSEKLEGKGLINQATGTLQDGYGKVREKVRDLIDEAPATAREAVDTGRDLYARGAAAVTRTAGDNTALAVLAAGVAGAALSWFLWSSSRKPEAKPASKAAPNPTPKPRAAPRSRAKSKA
jgi:uncharacterized protein YjbJ (UPF0337 family)